jgi:hypothetical protein
MTLHLRPPIRSERAEAFRCGNDRRSRNGTACGKAASVGQDNLVIRHSARMRMSRFCAQPIGCDGWEGGRVRPGSCLPFGAQPMRSSLGWERKVGSLGQEGWIKGR